MKLTKKEAIKRHRLLWNWIADETIRRNECVEKREAFEHFGWPKVSYNCWLCEYDCSHKKNYCGENCILDWGKPEGCATSLYNSLYPKWTSEHDPKKSAAIARKIANLPERKGV